MDDTNDETTPAVEEATVDEEGAEGAATEGECCKRRGGSFLGGVISGAIVGHILALVLARMRGEERARREMMDSGGLEGGEGPGEEGPVQLAVERAGAIVSGVASRIVAAWMALPERLRDAVEEGKEGIGEGQAEARARYEFMTKRRRPRRG